MFIDAGSRLAKAIRENPGSAKAVAAATGLLRIRTRDLYIELERPLALPTRVRRGPKLQGLSELVCETLIIHRPDPLPRLEELHQTCAGALEAGPSIAQIQKVLARIEDEGLLSVDRSRGPRFTTYSDVQVADLLRLWTHEYMPQVARSLAIYVTARDANAVLSLIKRAELPGRWALAGACAAQIWRPILSRAPDVEMWVDDDAWDKVITLGPPAEEGSANLTIRRLAGALPPLWFAHHQRKEGLPMISPARAYVETANQTGPRLDELADALLDSIA